MATYNGAKKTEDKKAASLKYGTLSGTVKKSGAGIKRQVLIYKLGAETSLINDSFSNSSTGEFSVTVKSGQNDRFRVICVGADGENSEIYEDVAAF